MRIDDYFASLERSLRQNPLVSHLQEPFTCLASDDFNGLVRGRAFFWDDSFLDLLAPSDQPSLNQVLAEIAAWLDRHPSA